MEDLSGSPSVPLTRADLDRALENVMEKALHKISEAVCADVCQELRRAFKHLGNDLNLSRDTLARVSSCVAVGDAKDARVTSLTSKEPLACTHALEEDAEYLSLPLMSVERGGDDEMLQAEICSTASQVEGESEKINKIAAKAIEKLRVDGKVKYHYRNDASFAENLLTHPKFEQCVGVGVALNALALGIETEIACRYNGDVPENLQFVANIGEKFFCVFFLLEWTLRVHVAKSAFFATDGRLIGNLFDTVMVILMLFEQFVTTFIPGNLSSDQSGHSVVDMICSLTKLFRCIRILRIVRLLHLFKDLEVQVQAIVKSLTSLVSTLSVMLITIYLFSTIFAQLFVQVKLKLEDEEIEELDYFFGSLPRTALTLLECIIDGKEWDDPFMIIYNHLGPLAVPVFLTYEFFGVFVMLNTIMGVFIDQAIKVAEEQKEFDVACAICLAFVGDEFGGEGISWEDFEKKLEGDEMQRCFEYLNVDISRAKTLFELIDVDKSGLVDANEILQGCFRLKGNAKALEMAITLKELNKLTSALDSRMSRVDDHLINLANKLGYANLDYSRTPSLMSAQRSLGSTGRLSMSTTIASARQKRVSGLRL